MQDSLSAGIGLVPVEAGQELRDACSALEL
jgi:hypothetical protein